MSVSKLATRLREVWRDDLHEDTRDTILGLTFFAYLLGAAVVVNIPFPW